MQQIKWTEDFVLGIEQFDAHHQHLISLINETTLCLEKEASQEKITFIIKKLIDYARYHFTAEEAWMKDHQFPQLEEHQELHKEFYNKIIELHGQLAGEVVAVAAELSSYLNYWLIDHILICDSLYATFAGSRKETVLMT